MPIFDWAVFRIFLSCNIISLLLSILTSFVKENVGRILSILVLFIITIYTILQAGFDNFLGVYISLGTSSQLGAVKEYIGDYFASFDAVFGTMLIPFVLYCVYKIWFEKKVFKNYYIPKKKKS